MAWTDPTTRTDGELINETIWNEDVVDNLAYLIGRVEPDSLTNKSGAQLTAGAVVVADSGNDNAFTTTTTADDPLVIGVVMETINNEAAGRVSNSGVATVNVQGNVARGDFLSTSTTEGRAKSAGTSKGAGTFAIALTAYAGGGAGTVTALVLASGGGSGGGDWQTFTPTVTQSGAVANTASVAQYKIVNKICNMELRLAITGSGSAGNAIVVGNFPAAAAIANAFAGLMPVGTAIVLDSDTTVYGGIAVDYTSTTSVYIKDSNTRDFVGLNPNFALANGDYITMNLIYSVA